MKFLRKIFFQWLTPVVLKKIAGIQGSEKVLIVRDDGIGDFLLFSGVLRLFQQHYGKNNVYVVVRNDLVEVASLYMPVRQVIGLEKQRYFTDWSYHMAWLNNLRRQGFSLVVSSIHRSSLGDDIIKNSGAAVRYGYEGERLRGKQKKSDAYTWFISAFSRSCLAKSGKYHHVLQHELHLFNEITHERKEVTAAYPVLPLSEPAVSYFSEPLRYIVWLPEAGNEKRTYPILKMIEIVKQYVDQNIKCVILASHQGLWQSKIDRDLQFVDLSGKVTLRQTFSILKHAGLVIGNETGLTHAAWILETPTVMIYGGGHYGRFLPLCSAGHVVTAPMECFACDWKCRYNSETYPCIAAIPEQEIGAKIAQLLACWPSDQEVNA